MREEDMPKEIVSARIFSRNRPATSTLTPTLAPSVARQLIALCEYTIFMQGTV